MSKSSRSLEERALEKQKQLDKLLEKVKHYEAQIKQLDDRKKDEDRRRRTHRLIEIGATVESVLGRPIEKEDLPLLIRFLEYQDNIDTGNVNMFEQFMNNAVSNDFDPEYIGNDL